MDKFSDMVMFVSIVKNNGLAIAGRELGYSPATMTARMQSLEAKHGVKLLNRSTRHLSLTDSGELYHKACLEILDNVSDIENLIRSGIDKVEGSLKISAPKDIGEQYILPILSEFCQLYPNVVPYLYLNDRMTNIAESGIDIVIRYGELSDSSLISRCLSTSRRVLCASPAYLAKNGVPLVPEDLINHDCLAMIRNNEELKTWHFLSKDKENKSTITITPKRFSDDGEVIRHWALEGAGIALKSILDVQADINNQHLVTILDDYVQNFNTSMSSANLNVVYISKKYQPKRIRLFLDFLHDNFPGKIKS